MIKLTQIAFAAGMTVATATTQAAGVPDKILTEESLQQPITATTFVNQCGGNIIKKLFGEYFQNIGLEINEIPMLRETGIVAGMYEAEQHGAEQHEAEKHNVVLFSIHAKGQRIEFHTLIKPYREGFNKTVAVDFNSNFTDSELSNPSSRLGPTTLNRMLQLGEYYRNNPDKCTP